MQPRCSQARTSLLQADHGPACPGTAGHGHATSRVGQGGISTCIALSLAGLVEAAVDVGDLCDPLLSLTVLEVQDFTARPVKVVSDVGYLLVQTIEGVAAYSPPRLAKSTSNSV
jgi:hypothetical protein